MGSLREGTHGSKKRVRFSFGPQGTGQPAAGAYSAADEVQQLRDGPAGTGAECDPASCRAAWRPMAYGTEKLRKLPARGRHFQVSRAPDTPAPSLTVSFSESGRDLGDERLDSWSKFAKDSRSSPPPYLSLINNFFKPGKPKNSEMRFKEKAVVEIARLDNQIKQAQTQQELLMEETRQLYAEKFLVQSENKFFLEYLTNKTEEYRKQPEKLWNNYLQKSEEIEQRRQESVSTYAKQTSAFKRELLQKEKLQFNLKQQLQALRNISLLKEKQEREMQMLQEEKKKTQAETEAKKQELQVQLLQEKAFLEKQLSEPDMRQLGNRKRKALDRKAQTLELEAKQYTLEFYRSIRRENRELQKKLLQQTQQCQDLQAIKSQLKNQKQQLQQEQWYVQCLIRGRQRMQRRHNWCPRQDAPKDHSAP
ncbi:coiled-coil domain-containing protein 121 [Lontra canadensis]|uniref:coiled-coil domain-containing protein 121 n=1 Tax=Lontra canadensis TaxID=76717 RepID=UPI0013F35879|nr:coiled-coil domain-containing protein 121 [Lontra canadensis]